MAKIFEGVTEAEAAIKACEAFGIPRSRLKYEVVERFSDRRGLAIAVDEDNPELSDEELDAQPQPASNGSERMQPADRPPRRGRRDGGGGGRGGREPRRFNREGRGARGEGRGEGRGRGRGGFEEELDELTDALAEEFKEFREMTQAPKTPVVPKPALDEGGLTERASRALHITRELLRLAKFEARAQISVDADDQVLVDIHGSDEGLIIGRKGETLLAFQFILNRLMGRESEGAERVAIDCEGYRERRQEALRVLALKLGEKAKNEGKVLTLSPMNAHDRRIFHITLDGYDGVKTRSEGEGLYRRVLIVPDAAEA